MRAAEGIRAAVPAPFLTVEDLAAILRSRPAKIRAIANRGEIAFYRVGKAMLFAQADLDAYLEKHRRERRAG